MSFFSELPSEVAYREALLARTFWREAVLNDPELGFVMLDGAGTILSTNDNATDVLLGTTADVVIGRNLKELFPADVYRERLGFIAQTLQSDRALLVTSVFRGVRCRCVYRRLPGDAGTSGHIVWTIRRAPIPWPSTDLSATMDVIEAQALDWGPLAVLSDDERAVFACMVSGRSCAEVAEELDLTPDALLQADQMIREKLQTENPVRLAQMAIAAGLISQPPVLLERSLVGSAASTER